MQIISEFATEAPSPLWVHCRSPQHQHSVWILSELVADPELAVDQPPCKINTVQILSELAADPIWFGCWLIPQGSTLCGSSLSWLQTLSELAVDWPPQDQHCRSSLSWLQTISELVVDWSPQGSTLCGSYLSWLLIDPPPPCCSGDYHQILSKSLDHFRHAELHRGHSLWESPINVTFHKSLSEDDKCAFAMIVNLKFCCFINQILCTCELLSWSVVIRIHVMNLMYVSKDLNEQKTNLSLIIKSFSHHISEEFVGSFIRFTDSKLMFWLNNTIYISTSVCKIIELYCWSAVHVHVGKKGVVPMQVHENM